MARILYLEDDDNSILAFENYLKRTAHTIIRVNSADEAWNKLKESVEYELIIMEVKLRSGSASQLIPRVKHNRFLTKLPIIVYSQNKVRESVHHIIRQGVQNYLFKPYKEKALLNEITKHSTTDWRLQQCGKPGDFISILHSEPHELKSYETQLKQRVQDIITGIETHIGKKLPLSVIDQIGSTSALAGSTAFPNLETFLRELLTCARNKEWNKVDAYVEELPYAVNLIDHRISLIEKTLRAERTTPPFNLDAEEEEPPKAETPETIQTEQERKKKAETIEEKILEVTDYPVIDSAAAAFRMATDEAETNLDEIVYMIHREPGLATQVLRFANSSYIAPQTVIEDIHQAIAVLGLDRVRLLALSLKTIPEMCALFTAFKWRDFWMHQVGCAMLCESLVKSLELSVRPENAYLCGLIHDVGKLLLCQIEPGTYYKAVRLTRSENKPLRTVEREHFGIGHDEAGTLFLKESNLSHILQATTAFQHEPHKAAGAVECASVLALANYICQTYEIGDDGDIPDPRVEGIVSHPSWTLLKPWLPAGFTATRFTRDLDERINHLKQELIGLAASLISEAEDKEDEN